ncbi:hypothetical protein MAM1_0227c08359 [Mucor ambiguus]|uniref:Uncharacterized protein n=1 Tax=Mucor ambiguus TaxID=91626 RepID=A0A0C9MZ19_9FUNG|nr:hypothetical protein MAM1_0227c08359 [Mucor ambiguus]
MHKYLPLIDKEQPSYLIITAALLKAEVYWVCSAISCLYHSTTTSKLISTHPTTSYDSSKVTDQIIITAVDDRPDNEDDATQLNEIEQHTAHRRLSLPLLVVEDDDGDHDGIRYRPSVTDEMTGTTCPPVWWQKAKIKLSHSRSNSLQRTDTHSSLNDTTPSLEEQTVNEACQPMLDYLQSIHSRQSSASSTMSKHNISSSFEKKSHHQAKKIMTKIKTRVIKITRHRRGTSLDLDELKL